MASPRGKSGRIAFGFRKVFTVHRRDDGGIDNMTKKSNTVEPLAPSASQLYSFESPKQQVGSPDDSNLTAPPTEAKESVDNDQPATSITTHGTVTSEIWSTSGDETAPTTASSATPDLGDASKTPTRSHEIDTSLAELRNTKALFHQRHASNEIQTANPEEKSSLQGVAIKKTNSKDNSTRGPLTSYPISPTHSRRQPSTAKEACDALQRRQTIIKLAYDGTYHLNDAADKLRQLKAHFTLKACHPQTPDLVLDIVDVKIRASQLGVIERSWISRFFALQRMAHLVDRRIMNAEDYEVITAQLFPEESEHIYKPEYFEIFMTGLGEDGVLTLQEAGCIARLGVTVEEFEKGAQYNGPSGDPQADRYNASALSLFDIPMEPVLVSGSHAARTQRNDLYHYLRILVEAAVYKQQFWKGYFFANARSRLIDFYKAHQLSSNGQCLPANLSDYSRPWTYREVRLLRRGYLLCQLLTSYEAGELKDFGIIRVIRGTFVQIPCQSHLGTEDLESFLYHRIADSGISASRIPGLLLMHPENDTVCANPRLRESIMGRLRARAAVFQKEEEERLHAIQMSIKSFDALRKAQMGRWQRVKVGCKKICGKKEVLVPFDPFAPE